MGTRVKADTDALEVFLTKLVTQEQECYELCKKLKNQAEQTQREINETLYSDRREIESMENEIRWLSRQKKKDVNKIQELRRRISCLTERDVLLTRYSHMIGERTGNLEIEEKKIKPVYVGAKKTLNRFISILEHGSDWGSGSSRESIIHKMVIAENSDNGRGFENKQFKNFSAGNHHAQEQITIKTKSGIRIRVDAIGISKKGKVRISEFKSSETATLTHNQKIGFKELRESGGVVVGKGKGIFSGGYKIPKGTNVKIIRRHS